MYFNRKITQSAFLALSLLIFSFYACKNEPGDNTGKNQEKTVEATPDQKELNLTPYPPFPLEKAQMLAEQCNQIDAIFYNRSISMSMDDLNAINQVVNCYDVKENKFEIQCPSQGRLFFISDGREIGEADIHFQTNGCHYLVFYENKKPAYGSVMKQLGINIFEMYIGDSSKY